MFGYKKSMIPFVNNQIQEPSVFVIISKSKNCGDLPQIYIHSEDKTLGIYLKSKIQSILHQTGNTRYKKVIYIDTFKRETNFDVSTSSKENLLLELDYFNSAEDVQGIFYFDLSNFELKEISEIQINRKSENQELDHSILELTIESEFFNSIEDSEFQRFYKFENTQESEKFRKQFNKNLRVE